MTFLMYLVQLMLLIIFLCLYNYTPGIRSGKKDNLI